MSFENPQQIPPTPGENEGDTDRSKLDRAKEWVRKHAALAGLVGAIALPTESFSDEGKAQGTPPKGPPPIVQKEKGALSEEYHAAKKYNLDIVKKVIDHKKALMKGEINPQNIKDDVFLHNYFLFLDNPNLGSKGAVYQRSINQIIGNGQAMRVLQIAWQKGIKIDVSKDFDCKIHSFGHVPVKATVNGVEVPITPNDLTDREKELVSFALKGEETNDDELMKKWRSGLGNFNVHKETGKKMSVPVTIQQKEKGKVRVGPDFDRDGNF